MNITLSAEKELIKKTRDYAAKHGTTMNQMIRGFMERMAGSKAGEDAATEFESLAHKNAGYSAKGYVFDRDEAHRRG